MAKKLFLFAAVIVTTFFGLIVVMGIALVLSHLLGGDDRWSRSRFDRNTWLKFPSCTPRDNPRALMVEDLRTQLLGARPSRKAVLSLLGPSRSGDSSTRLSYELGMWSGYRMDCDTLEIEFSRDGHVERVYTVQH